MTTHYMLRSVRRNADNALEYEYTGEYRDFGETAEPTGRAWCVECEHEFSLARLFPKRQAKTLAYERALTEAGT